VRVCHIEKYSLADGLPTVAASANPPHLPIAIYRSGDLALAGSATLPSCHQASD
jgi:hypothetical protein